MSKKETKTVWMSRDTQRENYLCFWSKRPAFQKNQGLYYYLNLSEGRLIATLHGDASSKAKKILAPIKLGERGLIKLTITAERIE